MLLLTFFLVGVGVVTAQTKKVTGNVISSEDNLPVIGATILVQGTTVGTITDYDGNFVLSSVPESAQKLEISYIGMKPQTITIQPEVHVVLKPDTEMLDEVVVVGYGTAKKVGTVVGSLKTVNSDKIASKPVANAMDALQGQVSGLQVYSSSGEPGAGSSVNLRGVGSLTAGNQPLYVLDGMPVSSSVMTTMNPNDFESITVLKDASATSIYGSRAANGVIFITTKKGKLGEKAVVSVSANYGRTKLARKVGNPMNAAELLQFQLDHDIIDQEDYNKYSELGANTNWQNYFFKKDAPTYQTNVSIQGGSDKTRFFLSTSYFNQDGLTPNTEYDRYTFTTNMESIVKDWIRVGANVSGSYDHTRQSLFTYQGSSNLNGGILGTLLNQPYFNPYDENGKKLDYVEEMQLHSPEFLAKKQPSKINRAQVNGSAFVQLTPLEGLTLRSQFGLEAYDRRNKFIRMPSFPGAKGIGMRNEGFARNAKLTITNTAEYKFDINRDHNFTVLLGHEGIKNAYDSFSSSTTGQNDDRLVLLGSGTEANLAGIKQSVIKHSFLSFFGRLDYSWKDKYYADFSVRNDASSRFGKGNRDATFVSGGFMWDAKKESFLEDISEVSTLRLKGSVGTTGNSSIGDYDHLRLIGTTNYNNSGGFYMETPGNNKLGWETQILTNLGFDIDFLDRFSLEFTYYHRKTKDMLLKIPLPYTSSFSSKMENVGSMTNSGVELSFNVDIFQNKDWYVGFHTNYAYNKNKITKLFNGKKSWDMPQSSLTYIVGEAVQFYMPVFAGVDPTDGKQMWKVPNSNETTKNEQLVNSGALNQATGKKRYAPHYGGFGLSASWKGLSFAADFSWIAGKYLLNNDRYFSENPVVAYGMNQSKDVLHAWKEPGDKTSMPKFGEVMRFDTHLLENASFLRLKNIGIAYQFPSKLLDKTKFFKSFKIMANARNLFTVTSYKGADPELDGNVSMGAYPNTKEFTIGAELTF